MCQIVRISENFFVANCMETNQPRKDEVRGWGHHLWATIHLVALGYPENPTFADREAYKKFYQAIGKVLPCTKCKANFIRHFASLDISPFLASRKSLFEWTVYLHNSVNKELGKPMWNVEYAVAFYEAHKVKNSTNSRICNYMVALIVLNIIVLTVGLWTVIRHKR